MRIIREIARGGFGRVEEVELDNGMIVARKVFDPSQAVLASTSLDKLKSRFKREVRVQSMLPPTYSIPILDYDLESEEIWYTMPLCERNFQTQIEEDKANGTIPKEALADIINALEELHSLDLKHRDLNPRNILLHEGRWIMDWSHRPLTLIRTFQLPSLVGALSHTWRRNRAPILNTLMLGPTFMPLVASSTIFLLMVKGFLMPGSRVTDRLEWWLSDARKLTESDDLKV